MASLIKESKGLGNEILKTGKSLINAPKEAYNTLFKKGGKVAGEAAEAAAKDGFLTRVAFWPVKKAGNAAVWMVEQPFALAARGARWGVSAVGKFARQAPVVAVGVAAVGGVAAYRGMKHRAEERMAKENDALAFALQQQAPAAEAAANAQATYSYKNSVSADESAALEAGFKANQTGQTGHAEAVTAARQQQQPEAVAQL